MMIQNRSVSIIKLIHFAVTCKRYAITCNCNPLMAPPDRFPIETFIRVFFNMYTFNNLLLSLIWFHNSRNKWGLLPLALPFLLLCEATKKMCWKCEFSDFIVLLIVYLQLAISSYRVLLRNNFVYAELFLTESVKSSK